MLLIHRDGTTNEPTVKSRAGPEAALLGLPVVLLAGLGLRLAYLLGACPFVDEYSTVMAARGILGQGLPLLPSGFFYGHDVLFSYTAAVAALLGPDDLSAVRGLSLLASLGTILLSYAVGRRLFSWRAGLLAAALVALSPVGVVWGARARAYALEQFLTLVAFWLFYLGVERERSAWRRLGLVVLVAAVFVHPEAAFLLAGLALAVLVLRSPRWWFHLDRMVEFALAGLGVVGRYLLQNVVAGGGVGGFRTISDARPTFAFLANWGNGFRTIGSFLLTAPTIPVAILALVAVLIVVVRRRDRRAYPIHFLALTLAAILLQMVLLIGGTWQSARYLVFALPLLFLLAGAGFEVSGEWLSSCLPARAAAFLLACLACLVLLPSVAGAVRAAMSDEIAYDRALAYLAERWQAGDRLATSAPAAAWVRRGGVDYFALGKNYEEFVWQKEGRWYDKWGGSPLIRTASELGAALDEAEEAGAVLWFLTDEMRLLQRFDRDFVQTVWDRMSLVYADERALVFRSRRARAFAVEVDTPRRETFGGQIALAGYALGAGAQAGSPPEGALVVEPGSSLPLRFTWQALSPLTTTWTLFVHLTDAVGQGYGQIDGQPLGGLYPMHLWQPGIGYVDHWTLTTSDAVFPGRYRLEIGFYDLDSGNRLSVGEGPGRLPGEALILDYVTVGDGQQPTAPVVPLDAELGGAIRLLGVSPDLAAQAVQPGEGLHFNLHWQANAPTDDGYTMFVHVVGTDGGVLTQFDGQPQAGFYPTSFWDPGERLQDEVQLEIPADAEPGRYRIIAGLYVLATGERLTVVGSDAAADDAVLLGSVSVEP